MSSDLSCPSLGAHGTHREEQDSLRPAQTLVQCACGKTCALWQPLAPGMQCQPAHTSPQTLHSRLRIHTQGGLQNTCQEGEQTAEGVAGSWKSALPSVILWEHATQSMPNMHPTRGFLLGNNLKHLQDWQLTLQGHDAARIPSRATLATCPRLKDCMLLHGNLP